MSEQTALEGLRENALSSWTRFLPTCFVLCVIAGALMSFGYSAYRDSAMHAAWKAELESTRAALSDRELNYRVVGDWDTKTIDVNYPNGLSYSYKCYSWEGWEWVAYFESTPNYVPLEERYDQLGRILTDEYGTEFLNNYSGVDTDLLQ